MMNGPVPSICVEATGLVYSIASREFRVTYPDGSVGTIWSPPWHEMTPAEEESSARQYAMKLYAKGEHVAQP